MLVDTNVLIDVFENDPTWVDWSIKQLRAQSQVYPLRINPIIYCELSYAFETVQSLDRAVNGLGIEMIELPKAALFLAARAFSEYRSRGGTKTNVLADFFIGAHAAVVRMPILTRDTAKYRSYFPSVKLISPQ